MSKHVSFRLIDDITIGLPPYLSASTGEVAKSKGFKRYYIHYRHSPMEEAWLTVRENATNVTERKLHDLLVKRHRAAPKGGAKLADITVIVKVVSLEGGIALVDFHTDGQKAKLKAALKDTEASRLASYLANAIYGIF